MKRLIAVIAALTLVSVSASAQSEKAFGQGDVALNLGYGIVGGVFDNSNNYYNTVVNPVSLSLEYGLIKLGSFTIGIGAYASANYADHKLPTDDKIYFGSVVAAGRAALHFNLGRWLDLGIGANIGYNFGITRADKSVPASLLPEDKSEFAWAPYVTARLMLTSGFGIFGEAGFGNFAKEQDGSGNDTRTEATFVNIGLTFNF